nr:vasopressin,Arg [Bos taurus]prf//580093B vasopressin,Arg [Equus caballus]prf//580181B vasopressin,Arg [Homo sapiens]prf//590227B vasopressin,Arg [Ovis aries]prf//600454C vasopressin,Arg [Tachyglossus aculeatus]prf//600454D vasopressin,Arg [Didelphis virginiana]prf//600456A vasopressin,Arg [Gallus gallus]prf//610025A vasopressin,Arg [Pecari tajacu]prf//640049B vasopressin,Arg [Balaenoptera physalus]prf//681070A vasopressin,Arg [Mus musculus]
CYFQNCPRG